jgi:leucyl/phenylalanyl-tRNA---protein transferase
VYPAVLRHRGPAVFPDPSLADDEGLVAVGGDLSPARLLRAYEEGIFPWFSEGYPPLWWCPNPRAVLPLEDHHVSRSMRRTLKREDYRVTWNRAFSDVVRECGAGRSAGTWILPEMAEAYEVLHQLGYAHSLEVWVKDRLVGGLYGVQRGGLFAAESMFHRVTDMSKVALLYCRASLLRSGMQLVDVQFLTTHLASLGAREISRTEYLSRVRVQRTRDVDLRHLEIISPLTGLVSG